MVHQTHPDLFEELHDQDFDAQVPAGAAPWWLHVPGMETSLALSTESTNVALWR